MAKFGKIVRILIVSDFLLHSGWGLLTPIFAIFIVQRIEGGSLAAVGLIVAAYWFVKSATQPFIAHFLDIKKGEKDDFKVLAYGTFMINLVPLGYLFVGHIWQVILLEILRGICMACIVPSWYGIFARHVEKGWEAFSWSIDSTGIGLAAAFAAAFGGIIASFLGFKIVFVLIAFFGFASAFLLLTVRKSLFPLKKSDFKIPLSEKPENQF
jgi:MFS family permease